ncbi:MAG: HAD family hydrolase [Oscillochloridaceae bacterium]|nr:HAD family hydrolase [Chloroflexaceae bacterium]MDW8389808.1 HAD family hydrolase [Oscillochloridaceae bacterium]
MNRQLSKVQRNVFLDRDGVINENRADHVKSWDEFRWLPGALEGLRLLTKHGFRIFIVTNQAAVNRGLMTHSALAEIHHRMMSIAASYGASITDLRFCPHRPDEACGCRKPRPGMLLDLAREYQVELSTAYMIGDAPSDIATGQAAGCQTILVLSGRSQPDHPELHRHPPTHIAANLLDAARWLCSRPALDPLPAEQLASEHDALHHPAPMLSH